MSVFSSYARYYDLLYKDKDYTAEAKYVHQLLQKYAGQAQSILELGCGTGIHAALLAEMGYEICGVDFSSEMLARAKKRVGELPPQHAQKLQFLHADIRNLRLNRQFDAVISLFHVISYQTTNADLQATFATAKTHLKSGGAFIFDYWYGAAVLSERPTIRIKRFEDNEIAITRIAEPVIHVNDNIVDVNYQIFVKNKQTGAVEELQEVHKMRYLFQPEIEWLAAANGFEFITCREWMSERIPDFKSWGVYCVCRAL